MDTREGFGKRLKRARNKAGLTQKELGMRCGWGDDAQGRISNYEKGDRVPDLASLLLLAKHTQTTAGYLAFDEKNEALDPAEREIIQTFRALKTDEMRRLARDMLSTIKNTANHSALIEISMAHQERENLNRSS